MISVKSISLSLNWDSGNFRDVVLSRKTVKNSCLLFVLTLLDEWLCGVYLQPDLVDRSLLSSTGACARWLKVPEESTSSVMTFPEMNLFWITKLGHVCMARILVLLILCFWVPLGVIGRTGNASVLSSRPTTVNIGALFTYNSFIGRSVKPAIMAAVHDVNSDPSVLHGTKLNVSFYDTNCSGFIGTVDGNS